MSKLRTVAVSLAVVIAGWGVARAVDNYAATAGSGLTFGAKLISAVLYPEMLLCDATGGTTCAAVKAGNTAGTTDVAVVVSDPNVAAALNGATPAGENHTGEVGSNIIPITNAMTTSNNAITAGKSVGGIQTLANAVRVSGSLGAGGTSGIVQDVIVSFKDVTAATSLDVWFFNAALAGATCADNTNFTLADADRAKVIGIAHLTDENGTTTATTAPTFMQAHNLSFAFGLSSATSLLACVVNRGATFTPADTSGASIFVTVMRQ